MDEVEERETEAPRTPEGRLIRRYIERYGRSVRSVAAEVPISDTRLRQWYLGRDPQGDVRIPPRQWYLGRDPQGDVRIPPRQLARVAQVLGIPAESLIKADRADAAAILSEDLDEAEIQRSAGTLTMEEIARQLAQTARRFGEIEELRRELGEARDRIEELEDRLDRE